MSIETPLLFFLTFCCIIPISGIIDRYYFMENLKKFEKIEQNTLKIMKIFKNSKRRAQFNWFFLKRSADIFNVQLFHFQIAGIPVEMFCRYVKLNLFLKFFQILKFSSQTRHYTIKSSYLPRKNVLIDTNHCHSWFYTLCESYYLS